MSKGSKQRPTDYDKFSRNYDEIFRKSKQPDSTPVQHPVLENVQAKVESVERTSLSGTVPRET